MGCSPLPRRISRGKFFFQTSIMRKVFLLLWSKMRKASPTEQEDERLKPEKRCSSSKMKPPDHVFSSDGQVRQSHVSHSGPFCDFLPFPVGQIFSNFSHWSNLHGRYALDFLAGQICPHDPTRRGDVWVQVQSWATHDGNSYVVRPNRAFTKW